MSEQGNRQPGITGDTDHEQHRAGPGEGVRRSQEETGVAEMSIFDGAGNESVVRLERTEDGRTAQGAGPDSESAKAEAEKLLKESRVGLSDKFSPGKH
ncbi:MAG: hypothetical protein ACRD1D_13735 [Acidimicrobiales bacterium]